MILAVLTVSCLVMEFVANTEICLYDKGDCCLKGAESKKYCSDCNCLVKGDF